MLQVTGVGQKQTIKLFTGGFAMKSIYGFIPAAAVVAVMGLAGTASAKDCKFVIEGSDAMKYNLSEIDATGCAEVSLTLNHSGKLPKAAMGHNWVLSLTSDKKKIVDSATAAGPAKDYAPTAAGVIAHTKLVGGGPADTKTDTITFKTDKLKKGGDYQFYCTFPGHVGMMSGKFKF